MLALCRKLIRFAPLAYLALSLLPGIVRSQNNGTVKVGVGDPAVDGSFIKSSKSQWKVTLVMTDGKVVERGNWIDELQIVDIKGRRALRRLQEWTTPDGKVFQTMVTLADAKTFAPIMSDFKRAGGVFGRKEYDGAKLKEVSTRSPDSEPKTGETKFEVPVFDFNGGMYGILLSTFPLKEGYSATLPIDGQDKDGNTILQWLTFNVKGSEKVEAGAGRQVEALVVETNTGTARMTFWLNKKEAPYVFKVTSTGPLGNTLNWTIM